MLQLPYEQLISYHHSLLAYDAPQCSLRPVTIKGEGAGFPLLDLTCILRVGCQPWRTSSPGAAKRSGGPEGATKTL